MIIEPDFLDHWKTRLLVRTLQTECAPLHVMRLWAHCQTRKTHRFEKWTPDVLASVCRWGGDAQIFWDAMMATFCRWENDCLIAHDWDMCNSSLIASWKNGGKGGRPSKKPRGNQEKTHGLPTGIPQVTHGHPADNPQKTQRVTDREEKRREDREEGNTLELLPPEPKKDPNAAAKRILQCLNEYGDKSFRNTENNLDIINARLAEDGVDELGVITMVKRQCLKWGKDPKMVDFLRPETLFGKTKFESYYASRDQPVEQSAFGFQGNNQPSNAPKPIHSITVADCL